MAVPQVIIELKEKPTGDTPPATHDYQASTTIGDGKTSVKVELTADPPGSDFLMYEHTLETGKTPFKLSKVWDDNSIPISIIKDIQNVLSVEAYYWTGNSTKVIMVGVTTGTGNNTKTTYYGRSGGNNWVGLGQNSKPPLINGDIERTLDDLVCSNYGAVTMDLSKGTSEYHGRSSAEPYCCRCEHHSNGDYQRTISVKDVQVSCRQHHHQRRFKYFKHTVNTGSRVARIRYYDKGIGPDPKKRRRIKSSGLSFPIDGVKAVHAIYCNKNPVLIYLECTGGQSCVTGWYQKNKEFNSDNGDEKWEKVNELSDITHNDLNDDHLECDKYNKLVKVLEPFSCGVHPCPQTPVPPLPDSPDLATNPQGGTNQSGIGARGSGSVDSQPSGEAKPDITDASLLPKAPPRPGDRGAGVNGATGTESEAGQSAVGTNQPSSGESSGGTSRSTTGSTTSSGSLIAKITSTEGSTSGSSLTGTSRSDEETLPPASPAGDSDSTPAPAALVVESTAAGSVLWTAFGSTSGTLAGAGGLTGLGWWAFKRSRGDPWVIHGYSGVFKECTILSMHRFTCGLLFPSQHSSILTILLTQVETNGLLL